jgi:hypothetical protein
MRYSEIHLQIKSSQALHVHNFSRGICDSRSGDPKIANEREGRRRGNSPQICMHYLFDTTFEPFRDKDSLRTFEPIFLGRVFATKDKEFNLIFFFFLRNSMHCRTTRPNLDPGLVNNIPLM